MISQLTASVRIPVSLNKRVGQEFMCLFPFPLSCFISRDEKLFISTGVLPRPWHQMHLSVITSLSSPHLQKITENNTVTMLESGFLPLRDASKRVTGIQFSPMALSTFSGQLQMILEISNALQVFTHICNP